MLRGLHIRVFFLFKCSRKQGFYNLMDSKFRLQESIKMEIFGTPPPRCKCGHGWSGQGFVFFTSIRWFWQAIRFGKTSSLGSFATLQRPSSPCFPSGRLFLTDIPQPIGFKALPYCFSVPSHFSLPTLVSFIFIWRNIFFFCLPVPPPHYTLNMVFLISLPRS